MCALWAVQLPLLLHRNVQHAYQRHNTGICGESGWLGLSHVCDKLILAWLIPLKMTTEPTVSLPTKRYLYLRVEPVD
jgi:hypothetical protein